MGDEPTRRDRDEPARDDALDELELERTPSGTGDAGSGDALEPSGGGLLPYVLVGVALLGGGTLAMLVLLFRTPPSPRPGPATSPLAARPGIAASGPASPSSAVPLPRLDDSDALARSLGAALSSHPELARWLGRSGLVRTLAAVVTNVADGESPRPHLEFLAPAGRFRARRTDRGRLVADGAGFSGYDLFGDVVASVDARAVASAYRTLEPLFDEAHRELGHPEGRFRQSLDEAVAALLAAPVPPDDAALVAHATLVRWDDPALERLTPAQKQLLRTGPRNVRLVQAKLRELHAALVAPTTP
jgi:hypothetical protein